MFLFDASFRVVNKFVKIPHLSTNVLESFEHLNEKTKMPNIGKQNIEFCQVYLKSAFLAF